MSLLMPLCGRAVGRRPAFVGQGGGQPVTPQSPIAGLQTLAFEDTFQTLRLRQPADGAGFNNHTQLYNGSGIYSQRYHYDIPKTGGGTWTTPAIYDYRQDSCVVVNALHPDVVASGWSPFEMIPGGGVRIKMQRRSTLPAAMEAVLVANGVTKQWVTGILSTQHSLRIKPPYYVETPLIHPVGLGYWTAGWTMGFDRTDAVNPGASQKERDYSERWPDPAASKKVTGAIHWHQSSGAPNYLDVSGDGHLEDGVPAWVGQADGTVQGNPDPTTTWITYGMHAEERVTTMYSNRAARTPMTFPDGAGGGPRPDQHEYVLLTFGAGTNWGAWNPDATTPDVGYFDIKSLRIWVADMAQVDKVGF